MEGYFAFVGERVCSYYNENKEVIGHYYYAYDPSYFPEGNGDEAVIYLIEGEKTLLYALDSGYFYDEVFEYLKNSGVKIDMLSIDCTYVDIPVPDNEGHMGFSNIGKLIDDLKGIGAVTDTTVCYVNHFSHNGNPEHDRLAALAAECGCGASYDGCCVEF